MKRTAEQRPKRPAKKENESIKKSFPTLRKKLLLWFDSNKRDYPWRKTGNWYHLLMAEMMLRRTRADQVLPVYNAFVKNFKTPEAASALKENELETLLKPLGLKWRARQLHKTIEYIKDNYAKRSPTQNENLRDIPGVGEYAESMLQNRLFDKKVATVDSNFARIICRWQGIKYSPEMRRNKEIRNLANQFVNSKQSQDLNLAMIDFSALVCKPIKPLCESCPLQNWCAKNLYP